MGRWPLPRPGGGTESSLSSLDRSREAVRAGADGVLDILHPLITLGRGVGRLALMARSWWDRTPKDRRGPALFVSAVCVIVVGLMPYGPALALVGVVGAAAWYGRGHGAADAQAGPDEEETARLEAVYEALVPYFAVPDDPHPDPLYTHNGEWARVFEEFEFTDEGRIARLLLRYPAHFRDGEPEERLRVEQLLSAKSGRGREYHFCWDEERNRLEMSVLGPLPSGIHAQRFVTGPGEVLLGFTDPEAVPLTVPVADDEGTRDVPPVIWRTGARSTESHLLAVGVPGSGTSTLLRSVVLQALEHGDVLVVDGSGAGEYACLMGRSGVLAVESSLVGALASLEWAVHETERRLMSASRARQVGRAVPYDLRRPLWIVLDRPAVLSHLAAAEGRRDPQDLLQVPLRHGRAARVTVAVAEQFECMEGLGHAVRAYTRARVVLGPASREETRAVLGEPPRSAPAYDTPPGRGLVRLGTGPVLRLQVPATPDPYDETSGETERAAVQALLPERASTGRA
ncbi:P-loop NTPase family protein [Streptomyces daliensis]